MDFKEKAKGKITFEFNFFVCKKFCITIRSLYHRTRKQKVSVETQPFIIITNSNNNNNNIIVIIRKM